MNIDIIIEDITKRNGTERAVVNLANILSSILNLQVTVFSVCSTNGTAGFELVNDIKIQHLNFCFSRGIWNRLKFIFLLHSLSKKKGIDVLIGTTTSFNCMLTLIPGKLKKIACEHFFYGAITGKISIQRRLLYPLVNCVVVLTRRDAENYDFIRREKLSVIPNSLPFEITPPPGYKEEYLDRKSIIAVGRLTNQKGFDLLLKSAVQMKQIIPDWHINVFGDGRDKEYLIQMAKELKVIDFVTFHPATTNIIEKMKESSIFLLSSRYEGFGMVLIEAQECGLPIVSFDCPEGPSEIVEHGVNGFLVAPENINKLAEYTIKLAKNKALRQKFGVNGYWSCQKYSSTNIANLWRDCLESH